MVTALALGSRGMRRRRRLGSGGAMRGHTGFAQFIRIWVAYLRYADKYFGPLASRLREVYQPVIMT